MRTESFSSFILGAMAGAVLGVLYAPDKGINTREKLAGSLSAYKDQLKKYVDDLAERKTQAVENDEYTYDETEVDETNRANQLLSDVDEMLAKLRAKSNS